MKLPSELIRTTVLDERTLLSLREVCLICDVAAEVVIDMASEGLVTPRGDVPVRWKFSGPSVGRIQRALRLQRDLQVNLAGAALALDLMDEVERLRRRCQRLGDWPG